MGGGFADRGVSAAAGDGEFGYGQAEARGEPGMPGVAECQVGASHGRGRLCAAFPCECPQAQVHHVFPGFRGASLPEDLLGFFLLSGGRVRQDCDLAPVKEPLSDAVVLLCLA